MVTHDLDSVAAICDRVAVLAEGRIAALGTMAEILASPHPAVHAYFGGDRARLVRREPSPVS
jgi:phospholipid/cholesterol/gamma-HCH transport system ATP-binding protein